jgi:hypothetical protein
LVVELPFIRAFNTPDKEKVKGETSRAYLVEASAGAVVVSGFGATTDVRRDGSVAFFKTVFILKKTFFPNPFLSSFSLGADGPPGAGELILGDVADVEMIYCLLS